MAKLLQYFRHYHRSFLMFLMKRHRRRSIGQGKQIKRRKSKVQRKHRHPHISSTLTEDLLVVEILPRLPPKSLLKLKAVCKSWRTLISNPSFIRMHLDRSRTRPPQFVIVTFDKGHKEEMGFYVYDAGSNNNIASFLFSKKFREKQGGLDPPQHCNGLLLLSTFTGQLHVCNPSTQELVTLPEGRSPAIAGVYNCRAGFAFVPSTSAFKVVRYFHRSYDVATNTHRLGFEVFTLGVDSSWRAAEDPPYRISIHSSPMPAGKSVYFRIASDLHSSSSRSFLAFNLQEEKFQVVDPPSLDLTVYCNVSVVDLEGKPCLVYCSLDWTRYDLWISDDCSNHNWVHSFSFNLELPERFVCPVAVYHGKLLLSINWESEKFGTLVYYDPRNKSFDPVVDLVSDLAYQGRDNLHFFHEEESEFQMTHYVESLVSPGA